MIVYKIVNLINGHAYVGVTRHSAEHRLAAHKRAGKKGSRALMAAFEKYGAENFSISTLAAVKSSDEAYALERTLILEHGTYVRHGVGYNLDLGGIGGVACPKSPEACRAMAAARRRFIQTPEGSLILKRCHNLMMRAGATKEVAEKRKAVIRASFANPARMQLQRLIMANANAERLNKMAAIIAVRCGPEHRTGVNLYVSRNGATVCRKCNRLAVAAYKARRLAKFAEISNV